METFCESQVPQVVVGEGGFVPRRRVLPDAGAGVQVWRNVLFVDKIGVDEIADHSAGEEHIEPAFVPQIPETSRPRPARRIHSGEVGHLRQMVRAGIEVNGVPHVLRNEIGDALVFPQAPADLLDAGHEFRVIAVPHVGDEEIDEPVVVQVAGVGAH